MEYLQIQGGNKIKGEIKIPASKNAILPIIACCIMIEDEVVIGDCPKLTDVDSMINIIQSMGAKAHFEENNLIIDCRQAENRRIGKELTACVRSSVFILGPLLSRYKGAEICYPGGCEIGLRPIDLHLYGLSRLGVEIKEEQGVIVCDGVNIKNNVVFLDFPSVGATENIIMASVLSKGTTVIHNCAREPEIIDLANFINVMGGKVLGAGSDKIIVEGVKKLHGGKYYPLSDRIVAGTYMIGCGMCGGDLFFENLTPRYLYSLIEKLLRMGIKIVNTSSGIRVISTKRPKSFGKVETQPYPGFPTDLQAQLTALFSISAGCSVMVENLFESRYKYVGELVKMGADITIKDRVAIVKGVKKLKGCDVVAGDLRGGAALIISALTAEGESIVRNIYHVDRGYESIENALCNVGASVKRIRV